MPDRFEDERGVILDLLGPVDAITRISTRKGAIRGNHVHHRTTQWTYVVSGRLLVRWDGPGGQTDRVVMPDEMVTEEAGIPHAWKALENAVVLVFTKGPRSGEAYETDTVRLDVPLLTGDE